MSKLHGWTLLEMWRKRTGYIEGQKTSVHALNALPGAVALEKTGETFICAPRPLFRL